VRTRILRITMIALGVFGLTLGNVGCAPGEDSELRQITPAPAAAVKIVDNQVDYSGLKDHGVWIDGWENGDDWEDGGNNGDRAMVELNPLGVWTIPTTVPFRAQHEKGFDVKVALTSTGQWVILELNMSGDTRLGLDHTPCMEEGMLYATMAIDDNPTPQTKPEMFEKDKGGGTDDGADCYTAPENK
jgi:hypothetical protein